MNKLIWIEINKTHLEHNIKTFRKLVGADTIIAPAVKSNAYGHGLVNVSKTILKAGADWLSVNSIDEAAILRLNKVRKPILVIGYIPMDELAGVIELNVKPVIYSWTGAQKLNGLARQAGKKIKVHIKLDTGMSRQGIRAEDIMSFIKKVRKLPNLKIEGLATHYASADEPENPRIFKEQRRIFFDVIEKLSEADIFIPYLHTANSAATLLYGSQLGNLVRPGKAIYGNYPSDSVARECRKQKIILKPILSLKTKVVHIKELPKGTGVSYGSTFVTKQKTKVAVLPIGYYDGYDRKLSNQGEVLIKGKRCRILGRICMNMFMVDISAVRGVKIEDEVVLIGKQGKEEITVEELAKKIGTINYEVVTRLRESMERRVV